MKKNKLSLYFIFASILTFLTVFFSVVQKSYFSLKQPQKLVENNALLKEIKPNLDTSVLSEIEAKNKNIDEDFDFSIIRSGKTLDTTATATPTQPVATPTAKSATSTGTLNTQTP